MNQSTSRSGLRLKISPATSRLNEAVDHLCRERDAELFKIQRASLEYRDKYMHLETAYNKATKENEVLKEQVERKERETSRVMFSFSLIGAIVASLIWWAISLLI